MRAGYFTPKQVQAPLAAILKKAIGIDGFNGNLKNLQRKNAVVFSNNGDQSEFLATDLKSSDAALRYHEGHSRAVLR